jgi:hypothetical protein
MKETYLYLFNLSLFDEENFTSAMKVVSKLVELDFFKILRQLPVKSLFKKDVNFIAPLEKTTHRKLCKNFLPSIDFSDNSKELASLLGISIELNFEACLKVLCQLAHDSVENSHDYIEWFVNIRNYLEDKVNFENYMEIKIICLKNLNNNTNMFYSLADIYFYDAINDEEFSDIRNDTILILCEYLNKTFDQIIFSRILL